MESSGWSSAGALIQDFLQQSRLHRRSARAHRPPQSSTLRNLRPHWQCARVEPGKASYASLVQHTVVGQSDWRSHIDDFKVGYLQVEQIVGAKTHVGVLCLRVLVALRGEGDIAAVGEEHAVFLQGAREDLSRGRQLRQVVGG